MSNHPKSVRRTIVLLRHPRVAYHSISGLAFSPTDANVLYVTLSGFDEGTPDHPGHVFKTFNARAASPLWGNVSPPVNLPMDCLAIDPTAPARIFVGSDVGLWSTVSGGPPWFHHGPASGLPNVAVFDLRMNSVGELTAFTHGRSAFSYRNRALIEVDAPVCIPPCLLAADPRHWLIDPVDLVTLSLSLRSIEIPLRLGRQTQPLQQNFESASVPSLPPSWSSSADGGLPEWTTTSNAISGGEEGPREEPLDISAFVLDSQGPSDSSLYSPTIPILTE